MSAPPKWFTVIAVIALIWNLLGCLAILADFMVKPEDIAKLPADQQALYAARTWWSTTASAIAVLGGALGSLGLILRKQWAMPFLAASLGGLIIQDFGLFVIANGASLAGPAAVVLQTFVLLIAIGLVLMARTAAKRSWIPKQAAPNG
jgi:hypothetical protein